jgi:hypothetical protein
MWGNAPNSKLLPKASTQTWRRIEAALLNYFRGEQQRRSGDFLAELEAEDDLNNNCERCPFHFAYLNLTELAKFLALELEGDA